MESIRQQKISKLVQKELANFLRIQSKILFNGAFISVTVIRISPDLSVCNVFVSIMPPSIPKVALALINEHKAKIRKHLGDAIGKQVRIIPNLSFRIDDSFDYALKINNLLK